MTPAYHYNIPSQATEEYLTGSSKHIRASRLAMLEHEIHTYFVHKIVLIQKTVFLDAILISRHETGGWFEIRQIQNQLGQVGASDNNKMLFYFEEERNAPILSPKYSLLRLR